MLFSEDTDGPWPDREDPERVQRVLSEAARRQERDFETASGSELDDCNDLIAGLEKRIADLERTVRYLESLTP